MSGGATSRRRLLTLVAGLCGLGALACTGALQAIAPAAEPAVPPAPRPRPLSQPVQLSAIALLRADGRPFGTADLRDRDSLVFFGYTHCPDVCPLTLVEMARLLKALGPLAERLQLYFVTVDPTRDTAERLLAYTAQFDRRIVGLTGSTDDVAAAMAAFGAVAQRRDLPERPGDYSMDHSAYLYHVDRSARIRNVYPYGTDVDDVATDLRPILQAAGAPSAAPTPAPRAARPTSVPGAAPPAAVASTGPAVRVLDPWARPASRATGGSTSAVYMRLENAGPTEERLTGVASEVAVATELHESLLDKGVVRMRPVRAIPIPAGGAAALAPGGFHVMLITLRRDLTPGDTLPLTLRFAGGGELRVDAAVRAATE